MVMRKVGKYEVGRTIGKGTFSKVKFAQNTETGESFAMKVLVKSTILKHRMVDQIKREISIMKIVRHPYIVRLQEVHKGRLRENECRRYFQQLIDAIDYCHSKGVYHRDLKPENILLDSQGDLKISDFGLSALSQKGVGLLRTTCGTPNYVAPEVLSHQGYDGSAADVWSCGVILYVLMAGYLPFDEIDLPTLYRRIRIKGIKNDPWFRKNYAAVRHGEVEEVNLDDVRAVFDGIEPRKEIYPDSLRLWRLSYILQYVRSLYLVVLCIFQDQYVSEQSANNDRGPLIMNAFEMITLSQGLNLSALFDRRQDYVKRQTRFFSHKPAKIIISTIETVVESMGLKVYTRNYKMRLEGISANKTGQFVVVLEIFEVAPSIFMVDVRKAAGDALEYHEFYKNFCTKLEHIIWKPMEGTAESSLLRTMTC
ncbi:hypothetical protein HHK36_006056 [Tetracentron sinense]|uniref:non-specific serine/threonine protein kinase n=1 Tax=Tetracentron sinense TaxID=13715 RepID=A0A834ZJP8_TETSI|nr:hypothetical protein HHK36_006056 [Tetracentron sinense]